MLVILLIVFVNDSSMKNFSFSNIILYNNCLTENVK